MVSPQDRRFRLFVYGTFLSGQPGHDALESAELIGEAVTAGKYTLVELGVYAGLLDTGRTAVHGELYEVDFKILSACDVRCDHPARFHRGRVVLSDDSAAHTYFVHVDQARGLRRLSHGDWKSRFAPRRYR
jgi:gamma-glutamylcyclotransferase (GGCT)/AIG2-like uncharacterized protein YtfP